MTWMNVVDLVSVCCLQRSRLSHPLSHIQTTPILMLVSDTQMNGIGNTLHIVFFNFFFIWTLIPYISKYTTGLFQYFPPLLQQKRQSMKNLKSAPPFSNIKVYLCLQFLGCLAAYVEGFIKVKVL